MKLWLDDVRSPPDESWEWVRTNEQAKDWLYNERVVECSLDHDLGLHDVDDPNDWDALMDAGEKTKNSETGLDLVNWMIENNLVPPIVRIHSWNPDGVKSMAARLNRFGYDCTIEPFKVKP